MKTSAIKFWTAGILTATSLAIGEYLLIQKGIHDRREETKSAIVRQLSNEEDKAMRNANRFWVNYAWDNHKDPKYENLLDSVKTYDSVANQYTFAKTSVNSMNIDSLCAEN